MLSNIFHFLRGCIAMTLIILNMLISSIVILFFASIAWLIPLRCARHHAMKFALKPPTWWMFFNKCILKFSTYKKWDTQGAGKLNPKGWYVLIANHESWMDIPVLGSVFTQKIPLIKFFMKKELLWQLPIAGLDCYLLGYPILARHSRSEIRKRPELKGKDIETTKKACKKFKEFPTTIMNFVEGTRFSEEKRDRQNSPYKNLLKPKSGGTAVVINEMQDKLDGIINVTIHYVAKDSSPWHLLCGKVDKIYIRYEVLPVTDEMIGDYYKDREFRKKFQQWLNQLWDKKDQLIETFKQKHEN